MSARTVTVFCRRVGNCYSANTHAAEALHPTSPEEAVRRAAARHFHVAEERIELLPDSPHVTIAIVKPTAPAVAADLLALAIVLLCAAGVAAVWLYFRGGAR